MILKIKKVLNFPIQGFDVKQIGGINLSSERYDINEYQEMIKKGKFLIGLFQKLIGFKDYPIFNRRNFNEILTFWTRGNSGQP